MYVGSIVVDVEAEDAGMLSLSGSVVCMVSVDLLVLTRRWVGF